MSVPKMGQKNGGFTLPGESGHEMITMRLADLWGADVIRDSDGTALSNDLLKSGLGIYSTICLTREDADWARANQDKLQQNFLMSKPVVAQASRAQICLLDGYSTDQFRVNIWDGVKEFWQVFDRTTGQEVPPEHWELLQGGVVLITQATPWHSYTVNFLVARLWEEISMYNHLTNDWGDKPRLQAVDPRYPEVADHLLEWLDNWCLEHPATTVVRFTSMFYNFAWFWGSDQNLPHIYTDWGSYDFTVSPLALRQFAEQTGLSITSEDFVNAGRYTSTHNPPRKIYRQWMDFIGGFVRELGRKFVDVVHKHGKQAFVFYDDSWIGIEPQLPEFTQFGFDGIVKSLFSGYEARLCGAVDVPIHELRLHPYLFPVDLEGKPTFAPGGHPEQDLRKFWPNIRRALLRTKIERIGLGGYPSLVEPFPEFQAEVARVADEHRLIRDLHNQHAVLTEPLRVGILTAWGALRTWSTSGHQHESPNLSLTHLLDSLSGLPYTVTFVSFQDITQSSCLDQIDVLVNAGPAGSAWSGGTHWLDPEVVARIRGWVAQGGGLIGVEDPTAAENGTSFFQLSDILGVDQDTGDRHALGRRQFKIFQDSPLLMAGAAVTPIARSGVFVSEASANVVAAEGTSPLLVTNSYGQGRAVYLSAYRHSPSETRLFDNALLWVARTERSLPWSQNPQVEACSFAGLEQFILVNSSTKDQQTVLVAAGPPRTVMVPATGLTLVERK